MMIMASLTRILNGKERHVLATGESSLPGSTGRPGCTGGEWRVNVRVYDHLISRRTYYKGKSWPPGEAGGQGCSRHSAEVIWPAWPATLQEETDASASPLADLQAHWDTATGRLRDSAKWMATVLGAALAAVIPTAPLTGLNRHFTIMPAVLGLVGLVFVGITLVFVLQVMRPQSVSYDDIQGAKPPAGLRKQLYGRIRKPSWAVDVWESPLYKWQANISKHPDLYLPCGVESLCELRQLMVVEEVTLSALASAEENARDDRACALLKLARTARVARLHELRAAAAGVIAVGVFYKVRACSTRATYCGAIFGLLGIVLIIFAVAWPGRT
jgi:hypothetical protein